MSAHWVFVTNRQCVFLILFATYVTHPYVMSTTLNATMIVDTVVVVNMKDHRVVCADSEAEASIHRLVR